MALTGEDLNCVRILFLISSASWSSSTCSCCLLLIVVLISKLKPDCFAIICDSQIYVMKLRPSLLSAFPSSEVIQIPSFATQDFPEPCWKCALPVISFRWLQPFKANFQKAKVIDLFPILFLLMNPLKLWKLVAVCPILELPSYVSPSRMTGAWDHAAQNGLRSCYFLKQRMSFNIYMPSGERL